MKVEGHRGTQSRVERQSTLRVFLEIKTAAVIRRNLLGNFDQNDGFMG